MTKRRLTALLTFALFLAISLWQIASQSTNAPQIQASAEAATTTAASPESPLPADAYPVVRVIDGDTLVVDESGKDVTVRVIGLDTPEIVDPRKPEECFASQASAEAKTILTGQSVRLESDPTQDKIDKYGRTLAYVYLPDGELFELFMIENGFGKEYTYKSAYEYQSEFEAAESKARAAKVGLWSPETCDGNTGTNSKPVSTE